MDSLLKIRLRAVNRERGFDREYTIGVGQDLFRQWYVTVLFGRYSTQGTCRTTLFTGKDDAFRFVHQKLRRRLTSPKRIGCPYQVVSFKSSNDILPDINKNLIDRFSWFGR